MLGISSVAAASLEAGVRTGSLFSQKRVVWVWSSQNTFLIPLASHRKPFFSRRSTASEVTALPSRILYQEHACIQTSVNTLNQSLSSLLNVYSMRKKSMKKISLDQKWYFRKPVNCPSSCELYNQGFRASKQVPLPSESSHFPLMLTSNEYPFLLNGKMAFPFSAPLLYLCVYSALPYLWHLALNLFIVHGQLDTGKV